MFSDAILVVDDDVRFQALLRQAFEEAGFPVIPAADGEAAVEILRKNGGGIAAAVVDLHLPGMSGFDVIREIATTAPQIKILAVSAIYRELYFDIARNVGAHLAHRKQDAAGAVSGEEWVRMVSGLLQNPQSA
jgi:CheY-like chemotaxis protein